jgi:hypothetical protein
MARLSRHRSAEPSRIERAWGQVGIDQLGANIGRRVRAGYGRRCQERHADVGSGPRRLHGTTVSISTDGRASSSLSFGTAGTTSAPRAGGLAAEALRPCRRGRTFARLCQRCTVAVAAARTSNPRPLMFAGQCHGQTPRCAGWRQRRCLGRRFRLFPALRVRARQTIRTRAAAEQHRPILSRTEPTASYGAASTPRG